MVTGNTDMTNRWRNYSANLCHSDTMF